MTDTDTDTPDNAREFPLTRFTSNRTIAEADAIYQQRIADALWIYGKHAADFVRRPCCCCGSTETTAVERFHGTYGVDRCDRCRTLFVNPVPNPAALADYYNNGACNLALADLMRRRFRAGTDYILDDRVATVLGYARASAAPVLRVLELGCNSGAFLAKLKYFLARELPDRRVELVGSDVDRNAIEHSVDPSLELICGDAAELVRREDRQFDLILHYELIEHLADPFGFMQDLHRLLAPGGFMIFTTPNAAGLEMAASPYNSYRLLAHGIFPPMHLNAFTTQTLPHFVLRAGFKLVALDTPGRLDVDMVTQCGDRVAEPAFRALGRLADGDRGLVQRVLALLGASSHMRCVVSR
jgi:2-polyprenyl-6-hydroxyphenyl methylase / 3-demethylubiquinone-9 3-methyltransferase